MLHESKYLRHLLHRIETFGCVSKFNQTNIEMLKNIQDMEARSRKAKTGIRVPRRLSGLPTQPYLTT